MDYSVFCDAKAGELIYAFDTSNKLAEAFIKHISQTSEDSHVEIIETLDEKLRGVGLEKQPTLPLNMYRIRIPFGQEIFKINWLIQNYNIYCLDEFERTLNNSDASSSLNSLNWMKFPPKIVTNSFYTAAAFLTSKFTVTQSVPLAPFVFPFTNIHQQNLQKINIHKYGTIKSKKRILIIDSGLSNNTNFKVVDKRNFLDKQNNKDVSDETGHGTAIASIIEDVLPQTELIVYKIVDKTKFATEWDLLAALCANYDASIINVSMSYGLEDTNCRSCGRLTEEARSAVLEWVISNLFKIGKIVVAAAGNKGVPLLSYPARLEHCVAVMSLNSQSILSDFSNHSVKDQLLQDHSLVFLAPGGNKQPAEELFSQYINTKGLGTSFSAAYASAIICAHWSNNPQLNASDLIGDLKRFHVDKNIQGYSPQTHGNGMLIF